MTAIGAFCTTAHAAADALPDLDDPVDYFKPNREHGAAMCVCNPGAEIAER